MVQNLLHNRQAPAAGAGSEPSAGWFSGVKIIIPSHALFKKNSDPARNENLIPLQVLIWLSCSGVEAAGPALRPILRSLCPFKKRLHLQ